MLDFDISSVEFKTLDEKFTIRPWLFFFFLEELFPENYDIKSKPSVCISISTQDFCKFFQINPEDPEDIDDEVIAVTKDFIDIMIVVTNNENRKQTFSLFYKCRFSISEQSVYMVISDPACALLCKLKELRSCLRSSAAMITLI